MLKILEEIRAIAQLGLNYSTDVYDRARYERLLGIASSEYASMSNLPPEVITEALAALKFWHQ